ncbi:hypothetical protein LWI29_026493 [Acer saccharum]|uniref:Auxin response factor n=1 Tax=Acer saccharum TaxID=4024 RepID=A0AA39SUV6_ACESA|nr:hypothetical protein LWI29_026493 [Acer saccharum]
MKLSTSGLGQQGHEGEKKCLNSELWHACAGPLVSLPTVGTRVVYFPQGHSEQVAATTNKEVDCHIPNYPSLPPQLICQLHNVTMHADVETDEVYAQMTLQPLTPQEQKDTFVPMELVFPSLDFTQQPPAQELIARDLHDVEWKFRHIFRGQPKRHLLTTGWSVFVSAKRLVAGDAVLFIWNEKNQLLLGIRRAIRPPTVMPSSVLSSDSMHIGLLAAAAHAAATNSCFTVFYNPRASPSEFVIPLSKYVKSVFTRVSVGMRFRMLFETEESSVRRYMGTITGINDLDPVRWPNSHWRSVKVGWDELKRPWHPGPSALHDNRDQAANLLMWLRGGTGEQGLPSVNFQSVGMLPWMQQRLDPSLLGNDANQQYQAIFAAGMQSGDPARQHVMQLQQPFQHLQQTGSHNPLLQQLKQEQHQDAIHQPISHNLLQPHSEILTDNMPRHLLQQLNNRTEEHAQQQQRIYNDALQIQSDQLLQRQQSNVPSPSFPKTDFMDSSSEISASITPMQNMLGSLPEETGSLLNFSRTGQPMHNDQLTQQSWGQKYARSEVHAFLNSVSQPSSYSGKDAVVEPENCNSDAQTSTLFGFNIDSAGLLLPTTVSSFNTSVDPDMSSMPLGDSGFHNSLYGCMQDSSELLHNAGQVDQLTPSKTFVKVYKSGSVGRSLDISRFSSYNELREELAQMFGIEGKLEDPLRSGWQLVFVDRENDVLLLGDDPWDAFVNNVWYIKILSPEDVQKMGEQGVESFSLSSSHNNRNGARDPVSSLEY